ncbi:hypothetical protein OFN64_32915, partial [Escherichia coli]|nr:hypothetical protein [Escherichia coli]
APHIINPFSFSVFIIRITVLNDAKYRFITNPETTTTVGDNARRHDNSITNPIDITPPMRATKLGAISNIQGANSVANIKAKLEPLATPS